MPDTHIQQGFNALNLPAGVLRMTQSLGFTVPTPIQREAIPPAVLGRDIIGIAQTGTGKTLAFGLPMAARLQSFQTGLVLAPTRELAIQIEETFKKLNLKTALLIGGAPMNRQIGQLRGKPAVVIATPGRLLDHLQQRTIDLRTVSILVLDEADRMLDMGFAPAIRQIIAAVPNQRQTMLFSATMPREIADLAARYLTNPIRIEIERAGRAADLVEQELMVVDQSDKRSILEELLSKHKGTILVFARTRHGARKVAKAVRAMGHSAAELHSDRTLAQRRTALEGFKRGEYRVLVATDIAARGIDVKDIALVINYDVPDSPEDYVHRIGRTGRAGASGQAITMATPEQSGSIREIEKLMRATLPRAGSAAQRAVAASKPSHRRRRR
jgi:ATP-dependent RNA helicase RhlE